VEIQASGHAQTARADAIRTEEAFASGDTFETRSARSRARRALARPRSAWTHPKARIEDAQGT